MKTPPFIRETKMQILVAEDDDGHAELIMEGLRSSGINNEIKRFCDGEKILAYLEEIKSKRERQNGIRDLLLLLDINMPRMDGIETLKRIKDDPLMRDIPVIILTTTDDPREVEHCYKLGCSLYVSKPIIFSQFVDTLHRIGLFLQIVRT